MVEDEAEVNVVGDEVVQMEQVRAGEIGQHHTDGDGEQEQRLEFLDDGQVHEDTHDDVHDQKLPCGGVEGPAGLGQVEETVTLTRGGEQHLPDTRAGQKVQEALNQIGHG